MPSGDYAIPLVNECYDVYPSAGNILLQSEGFELFDRKFDIQPLNDLK